MTAAINAFEPTIRVLKNKDLQAKLDNLQKQVGTYEDLLEKAEFEALTADERALFRKMQSLKFLLK